jgi:hypothetical protein
MNISGDRFEFVLYLNSPVLRIQQICTNEILFPDAPVVTGFLSIPAMCKFVPLLVLLSLFKVFHFSCFNSFQAIARYTGQENGVLFLQGRISLKNWSYRPFLRESATPFKSTCLLI